MLVVLPVAFLALLTPWAWPAGRAVRPARVHMLEGLDQMSYRELQAACKAAGLPASGKADALRLTLATTEGGAAPAEATAAPSSTLGTVPVVDEEPFDDGLKAEATASFEPPGPATAPDSLDDIFDDDDLADLDRDFGDIESVLNELDGGASDDFDDIFQTGASVSGFGKRLNLLLQCQ